MISCLDDKGRPGITQRVFVLPPGSQIGPITSEQRKTLLSTSLVAGVYEKVVDRDSAYEKLKGRAASAPTREHAEQPSSMREEAEAAVRGKGNTPTSQPAPDAGGSWLGDLAGGLLRGSGRKDSVLETVAKSAARTIGSSVGREIIRGVLGSLLGGSSSRRR